ncbi:DUF1674-domain-containing protein [Annulohypoxylon maeteangense]|uniref:DUF1674-domain-containing protein n=1 Tax=Annulohypoxylon maeteangense TaxID=1927788 RepID=UPI0020075714|nr:DUF1674-domain-containing protein [Annulohypoxylon maeteangense]KAI0880160.1 DUF1674-domain-containing protein [Annulohypoxylon maeteangense]
MALRLTRAARLSRQFVIFSRFRNQQPIRYASNDTNNSSPFQPTPSPLRLPPDQQAEFERLQRTANTQEGFNPTSIPDFSSPVSSAVTSDLSSVEANAVETPTLDDEFGSVPLRKGAPPEFEGDVNPKTGEVGGPKNEPLRWGPAGDYSFNGRVTDF